jgi:hypothetical protein
MDEAEDDAQSPIQFPSADADDGLSIEAHQIVALGGRRKKKPPPEHLGGSTNGAALAVRLCVPWWRLSGRPSTSTRPPLGSARERDALMINVATRSQSRRSSPTSRTRRFSTPPTRDLRSSRATSPVASRATIP